MNIKRYLVGFLTVFAVTLIVWVIVTMLWNRIFHGASAVDWETAFRFAIVFGIIVPWIETRSSKEK
jgi:hypothetical protein